MKNKNIYILLPTLISAMAVRAVCDGYNLCLVKHISKPCYQIIHSRFPKNRDISAKWNLFLGIDPNKILNGTICAEHFDEICFKNRFHSELEPNSVPTKLPPSFDEPIAQNSDENCENSPRASPVATTPTHFVTVTQECMECKMKDELVEKKDVRIKDLKNRLRKAQKKYGIWRKYKMS